MQALAAAGLLAASFAASAQESFKLGVVTFLSGPAAESFGVPAANAAKLMVEQFNAGKAPAPYNQVGFGGMKIEMVMVDEAGGAAKQVQELRNLYQRENVDAVVGYIGSGDCLAVAPVAEELKKFLVLFDCGTPRIFEEASPTYVFRTSSHATMDNVSLARYLKAPQHQGRDLQPDQPGLRLGPGLARGLRRQHGAAVPQCQAGCGPAAQVRRRPVRHRGLGAVRPPGRPDLLQPVGRRPAGLHPAGGRARPVQGHARSC